MPLPTGPTAELERIFRAIRTNYLRITNSNGFYTNVGFVDEIDGEVRDEDHRENRASLLIYDDGDDYEYRTAGDVRGFNTYRVMGWISDSPPDRLRLVFRKFQRDFWVAHHYDLSLALADAVNGNAGSRLVTTHNIVSIRRFYQPPEAIFVARVEFAYDFNSDET